MEEASYTLTSLETEWGSAGRVQLSVWSFGDPSPSLITKLGQECAAQVETHQLSELGALSDGLAMRYAKKEGQRMNLVPSSWQEGERSRHARTALIASAVVFLTLWISAFVVFSVGLKMQRQRWASLQADYVELEAVATTVKTLQGKVQSLEAYADRSRSSLECLREVSVALPDGVDLTLFAYKKGRTVNVRGNAKNEAPIYDFIAALEKSDMFVEIKPEGISSSRRRGKLVTEFKMIAKLPGEEL